jgi:hypothetical protein
LMMAEAEIFQKCGRSKSPRNEWRPKTCVEFRKRVTGLQCIRKTSNF